MATPPSNAQVAPALPEGLTADSIDTLPVLSAILSRLQNPSPNANASTSASPSAASPSQLANGTSTLTIKDIPAATDELKHKLHKAREQVKELPDLQRSMPEQDVEIRELEERIREQRRVLESLRDVGLRLKKEREVAESAQGDPMES